MYRGHSTGNGQSGNHRRRLTRTGRHGFLLTEAALSALILAFLLTAIIRGCTDCLGAMQRSRQLTAAAEACQLYLAAGEETPGTGWQIRSQETAVTGGSLQEVQVRDGEKIICNLLRFHK